MFIHLVEITLVFSLFLLWYTYLGYPLLLVALTWFVRSDDQFDATYTPSVSMIVAAHNEAEVIEQKLENIRKTDYNGEFECIVVSDSTDETDTLVNHHSGERTSLLSLDERRGKSHAINEAVSMANGSVLVFSDANTMYDANAISQLVKPLADQSVGCTTGQLRLVDETGETAESAYWRYELWIRRLESKLGTTVSTNGGMIAIRHEDFSSLPKAALSDDLVLTLQQIAAGQRVVYVDGAVATESTTGDLWSEYSRRVRIGAGNYQALSWFRRLLRPLRNRGVVVLEFLSHKVLRWAMPAVLATAMLSNLCLVITEPIPLFVTLFVGQLACYTLAILGMISPQARKSRFVRVPAYFLVMNLAFAIGFRSFLKDPSIDIWQSTR
jgi:biofilm PGA synthesis N-glycosyltransferase PgaC